MSAGDQLKLSGEVNESSDGSGSAATSKLTSGLRRQAADPARPAAKPRPTLGELLLISLYLGAVGFGGGVSVLAVIQSVTVERRGWLSLKEFSNTATIAQMLPGGAAANALACIGLRFQGVSGAATAYFGFIFPGAVATLALAWLYTRFGTVPHADAFLSGLNAAVVGIIGAIVVKMARTSVSRAWQMAVVALVLILSLVGNAGALEIVFIGIAAGLVWDLGIGRARVLRRRSAVARPPPKVALPDEGKPLAAPAVKAKDSSARAATDPAPPKSLLALALPGFVPKSLLILLPLALVFFRTGLGAYGGGFAVIPALHSDLVETGQLTERQFADAVAVGKLTPGPVLLLATFIGFIKEGFVGALTSTFAILVAPFALVVMLYGWLMRVRSKRWVRSALRGLTPAVVGLMLAAAITVGRTLHTGAGLAIAAAVALTLIRFERVNPVLLLAIAGAVRAGLRVVYGV